MIDKLIAWLFTRQLRPILVNWKTTLLGILAFIPSIRAILGNLEGTLTLLVSAADEGTLDIAQLKLLIGGIGAILSAAFIFAKDANKSTETSTGETPPKALPY